MRGSSDCEKGLARVCEDVGHVIESVHDQLMSCAVELHPDALHGPSNKEERVASCTKVQATLTLMR